jgi:cytoskeletal protein CcmA (bactofilin family)
MSIFRRDSEPSPTPQTNPERAVSPAANSGSTTLVAPGSQITGEVRGDAPVHVAGRLDGRIQVAQTVVIGPQGQVHGDVDARTVRIGGRVVGNVRGAERVELLPSGSLEGDIHAPRVIIEEGAYFKGQVEMTGEGRRRGEAAEPATAPAAPPRPERTRSGAEGTPARKAESEPQAVTTVAVTDEPKGERS